MKRAEDLCISLLIVASAVSIGRTCFVWGLNRADPRLEKSNEMRNATSHNPGNPSVQSVAPHTRYHGAAGIPGSYYPRTFEEGDGHAIHPQLKLVAEHLTPELGSLHLMQPRRLSNCGVSIRSIPFPCPRFTPTAQGVLWQPILRCVIDTPPGKGTGCF